QRARKDLHHGRVARRRRLRRRVEEARGAEEGAAPLAPRRRQPAERERARARSRARHAFRKPHRGVPLVAGERLVAAVPCERDGHLAPGLLADEEERERGLVAERLVERIREPRQRRRRVWLEDDLLVA